ncbi:uncharacterized protein [Amphiura filiformis]|uniref:uncharacterized protein n=1 Tax=Amphiura filiformis TaxID=82378 RepID=UPI003B20EE0F
MDLTIRHIGKFNDTAPDGGGHRRVLVVDTLDIALLCLLTATVLLVVVLCLKIKAFRRRRSRSYMANDVVDFINKEVSTQACQLEILTETKCVYVQMYDGMGSQSVRCSDAWTQTSTQVNTDESHQAIFSRQNQDTKPSAAHSKPPINPKKPTGIIHTLSNFYSRHTAENQYLHPFSVSQLVPSNYKGKFSWKQGSFGVHDDIETDDPRARLCERNTNEQRRFHFRRQQNEDGIIEGFENPIFRGVTHLDEYGQPVSRL